MSSATIVRRYFTCLERGSWDELGLLCTEGVRYVLPAADRVVVGRAAFQALAVETFSSFITPRFVVLSLQELESGAVAEYEGTWLDSQAKRVGLRGTIAFRFAGELISEIEVSVNVEALAELTR